MTILSFLISLLAVGSAVQPLSPGNRTLLKDLVGKFDSLDVYENRKIAKIQRKKEACEKLEGREQMEAWLDVAYEYSYFDSDSTIAALERVAKMVSDASDSYMSVKTAFRISRILTTLGYYKESSDIIDSIDKKSIPVHCFSNISRLRSFSATNFSMLTVLVSNFKICMRGCTVLIWIQSLFTHPRILNTDCVRRKRRH